METTQNLRTTLLDALLNELYYRHRAHRAAWFDTVARSLTAVLSTGAVVTFAASWTGWAEAVWRILSLAAAAASVTGPILQFSEKSRKWSELAANWSLVVGECRTLHLESLSTDVLRRREVAVIARAEDLQREDTTRRDDKLVDKLMGDVKKSAPHLIRSPA